MPADLENCEFILNIMQIREQQIREQQIREQQIRKLELKKQMLELSYETMRVLICNLGRGLDERASTFESTTELKKIVSEMVDLNNEMTDLDFELVRLMNE